MEEARNIAISNVMIFNDVAALALFLTEREREKEKERRKIQFQTLFFFITMV